MSTTVNQYGFYFDQSRCIGCRACTVACKSWNQLAPGPEKWLRIFEYEEGAFPNVTENMLFVPCFHCENPVCVDVANGAMYKEDKFGIVLIDPSKNTSPDLRTAWNACPYGSILFDSDATNATASKCDMCYDKISVGELPACVTACPMRALDFGPISDLRAKYGSVSDLPDLPSSTTTNPAVVFKAKVPKQALIPYDASRAAQLMGQRTGGLPALYTDTSTLSSLGGVGRSSPVLKAATVNDLMAATRNDDA
ncbi:MAG: 4Fe-4S dicluster domain-containing protein [Nitrososphaerota archaeon]|nr:4Fe-4S dicluster domain-containing protein [Nitrososphaerota archaeon]MDG6921768.1 4Fe-4S dicluster domain-containing protein [Nitrososphaerota archaeon]